ncbi:MAG: 7-cyano-7-deazaguanine synthase QueC [Magnetococcales bacterium]|nr:7-cyano-7-deazaguanine synthase QueC [Magnetococcales bacterium]
MSKAVVLLSGGLDSATCLYRARADGHEVHALSLRYGQRHGAEMAAARTLAAALPVARHLELTLDLGSMGGSALTDPTIAVPKGGLTETIPVTYVPARNTILLALALGWAESLGAHDLYIGVNALDYSGYPDCRPAFIAAFEQLANLATRDGVSGRPFRIHAPLLHLSKRAIIQEGLRLGVDYGLTRSCYDPDPAGRGCRLCDACRLRLTAFAQLGLDDPAPYVPDPGR